MFDRTTVNMTSCSEIEEEIGRWQQGELPKKDGRNYGYLEAMPMCMNWGHIFSLPNETHQHMVVAFQHPQIYTDKVMGIVKMSKHPSYMPLVARLSLLQTMIYYCDPNPTIFLCS